MGRRDAFDESLFSRAVISPILNQLWMDFYSQWVTRFMIDSEREIKNAWQDEQNAFGAELRKRKRDMDTTSL